MPIRLVFFIAAATATPERERGANSTHTSMSDIAAAIYELPTPHSIVVFTTGGGIQLATYLLATPGASRCMLEVQLPYSRASTAQLLGYEPARYATAEVAAHLATSAFERAKQLGEAGQPAVGLGGTAKLRSTASLDPGDHRAFFAVRTEAGLYELELALTKGARSRLGEDSVVSGVALIALANACGVALSEQQRDAWRLVADVEGDDADAFARLVEAEKLQASFAPHADSVGQGLLAAKAEL